MAPNLLPDAELRPRLQQEWRRRAPIRERTVSVAPTRRYQRRGHVPSPIGAAHASSSARLPRTPPRRRCSARRRRGAHRPDMVVSQVYAGGGNSGATFANDFVELFNRGSTSIDLGSWSIQYASASGTSWQATPLVRVGAGRRLLPHPARVGRGDRRSPPDARCDRHDEPRELGRQGRPRTQRHGSHVRSCARSCSADPLVADLIGYGSATDYEGSGAAGALEQHDGCRPGRRGLHGHGRERERLLGRDARTSQLRDGSGAVHVAVRLRSGGVSASAASTSTSSPPSRSRSSARTSASGTRSAGDSPAAVSERVTVSSNNAAGYALSVHRSAFRRPTCRSG